MLSIDYGTKSRAAPVSSSRNHPVINLARIWSLRVLIGIGPMVRSNFHAQEVLRQLDLAPGVEHFDELAAILADPDRLQQALRQRIAECPPLHCQLGDNLVYLAERFRLSNAENAALACLAIETGVKWFRELLRSSIEQGLVAHQAQCFAIATGLPERLLLDCLNPSGKLNQLGLVVIRDERRRCGLPTASLQPQLAASLLCCALTDEKLLSVCSRPAPDAVCRWEDFDIDDPTLQMISKAVSGFIARPRSPAAQLLIHGAPGTGKTQLVRALAAKLKLKLREVPETQAGEYPLKPHERLLSFQLGQSLLAGQSDSLILFDEADQVLGWSRLAINRDTESWDKGWVNRVLETSRVPCIWVANNINQVHPAILRRFRIVCEMPRLRAERLSAIFLDQVGQLPVCRRWLKQAAESGHVSTALIRNAAEVTDAARPMGTRETTRLFADVVDGHLKASGGKPLSISTTTDTVDLPWRVDWLPTKPDVRQLSGLIADFQPGPVRVLLHGPPGSGKTALARELARWLDRPLLSQPASQILGAYVGQTERSIAGLFDRASSQGAVLLLDEADSLLRDREAASQPWQITQVNELLMQIERFDGLLLAATNRLDSLDPACLRRFELKIRFDYLPTETLRQICRTVLKQRGRLGPRLEARIAGMHRLTLGDFATALRNLKITRKPLTGETLLNALEQEARAKPGHGSSGIGFVR